MSQQQEQQQQQPQEPQQGGAWPRLVSFKEVVTAIIVEKLTEARPLREKMDHYAIEAWQRYVDLVSRHPILTTFISCLVLFSAGPVIVFATVLGASLGFLVGTAAVIILFIQSIIASIAGAILLVVLGSIFVLTTFLFFWVVAAVVAQRLTVQLLARVHESTKHGPQLGYDDSSTAQHSPGGNSSRGSFEDIDDPEETSRAKKGGRTSGLGTTDGSGDALVPQ